MRKGEQARYEVVNDMNGQILRNGVEVGRRGSWSILSRY